MPQIIPLQPIPRQTVPVMLDGSQWSLRFIQIQNCMYVTIIRDGVTIVDNSRCVAGFQLMPARWMEGQQGNFSFVVPNDELPWYENFGTTHQLIYATAAELAAIRGGNGPI